MSQVSRGPPTPRRHSDLYIDSGDVVFLVESQLFKVHRYFFVRESQRFKDMLNASHRPNGQRIGTSDSNPLELRGVTAKDFTRFLWVFYNPDYSYEASVNKWSSILRLAHTWKFPKVKELAVREMDKLEISPVDKAVMAREFEVDPKRRWLETAYAELGAREQPITKEEGTRLGLDVVLHLAEVRERIRERRRLEAEAREAASVAASRHPRSPMLSSYEQLTRHRRSPLPAAPVTDWPQYVATVATDSRPISPAESERSYDPKLAESTYLPPRPATPPQYRNQSMSRSGSSLSPRSLTTPPRQFSSVDHQKVYTEEDVAAVKSVFTAQ
ncbi:uncharacterized protein FOMMEDRAFT_74122 [Fomitiporia mediterranea MF3/22]|uniref:uncharacterized protein n=1 Tax=Fomitiporia mediterranea (strain MF3/22) TaxID=694068 RepID=UPI0004409322|nr:uncharacterized protein FOMMEDRAFT_74122 [Fomitiporia mediterranea MF3/22]EJD08155.1 hypothetical protein FOMMEDRAFT_74122 [Fomitiporia mediterranea MF3/22]